jgi:hypothetical protein
MEAPYHAQITAAIHVTPANEGTFDYRSARSKGSTGRDKRMFVEGVLWIVRTDSWVAQGIWGQ